MSGLISRQAVENITWEEPSYSDPLNVLTEVRERVRALPSVENKGEWIPVTERLPEENTHVLVSVMFEGKPYVTADDYFSYGFDDWKDDVIAWQPLPEPYKGESGISE